MANTDIRSTATTALDNADLEYNVFRENIDEANEAGETHWDSPDFTEYLGYYKKIPELKKAVDALAMWTTGKGYESPQKELLDNIIGWGEDSFLSILWNMIIIKKINGDAYAEIIRNERGTLVNLKPLSPNKIRTVVNNKGIIVRYEEIDIKTKKAIRTLTPDKVFHLVNDRVANEIHGTSVVEACKWVIDARNEAMSDWRRLLHRSTIRIIEVDVDDDTGTLNNLKEDYKEAIKCGEVLLVPKGTTGFPDTPINFINPEQWISYLENFFYQAVGVPKIILGGSQEFTEASSKVGYLTFEQVYISEQKELESDLWNQLAIKIEFNKPTSLKDNLQSDEAKNTGQINVQPNDTQATIGGSS